MVWPNLDELNRSYEFSKFLFKFKIRFNKGFLEKQFTPRTLGYFQNNSLSYTPVLLFIWVTDIAQNPLAFFSSPPRSLPRFKQYPRERKGWRGLPAAIEVRRGAGLARGGSGGHNDVWLDSGDGRNRSVHVRRREFSSLAGVPANSRRSSSIQWHGELHRVM